MGTVIDWLKEAYKLDDEDAEYIAGLAATGDSEAIVEAFIPVGNTTNGARVMATNLVADLMLGYRQRTKHSKPEPKPLVEMTPSPNVDIHMATAQKVMSGAPSKPEVNIVFDESEVQPKDPDTIDLKAPPKYSLSHNMGINQIQLLKSLIASVKVVNGEVIFNQFDPDGGGIPLDDARPGFATLLMRGGICEVVDAVMIKKSGKPYWGKRVIPILPTAQLAIEDYKIRKPDKWVLING